MSQKLPFVSIAEEYTEGFDNFFLSSLSVSSKLTAGAFSKDMIPGNKFAFEIFTGDNVVTFGQLESGRRLQVAFLLYHRDIDVKGLADVSLSYDSDICLFTYGLVNCRLLCTANI